MHHMPEHTFHSVISVTNQCSSTQEEVQESGVMRLHLSLIRRLDLCELADQFIAGVLKGAWTELRQCPFSLPNLLSCPETFPALY